MNAYYVFFLASLVDGVISFPWSHFLSLFISPTVLPCLLWWLSWGHILAESALPLAPTPNPFLLVVPRGHLTKTLCICHLSPGHLGHPALLCAGCSGLPLLLWLTSRAACCMWSASVFHMCGAQVLGFPHFITLPDLASCRLQLPFHSLPPVDDF